MRNLITLSVWTTVLFCIFLGACPVKAEEWKPVEAPLMTPFGRTVTPEHVWPEYPRPQMVRRDWMNLNGLWDYALEPVEFTSVQGLIKADSMTTGQVPSQWAGKILVPFAIDSPLSGIMHVLRPTERLWYRKKVVIPVEWKDRRVLLHVEAADWETSLYVNGRRMGQHRGGYDPFCFDITDALKKGDNEIAICCWDGTEQQCQAIGKQIMPENRQGFRYQPTGGIWQSVWLEPVPEYSIAGLKMTPDISNQKLLLIVEPSRRESLAVEAVVRVGKREISKTIGLAGQLLHVSVPTPRRWSPEDPFLYDLNVTLKKDGCILDEVSSYFGMRSIEIKNSDDGVMRMHLNERPIFQFGPLDQGYWPDGILTPPSDDAIRFELEYLKSIGCNMVRVHIKKHPARWYYWADKLGLLVWQDMICTPKYGQTVDAAASAQWRAEFDAMIDTLYNHPSIIQWIVFNEAWGQHSTIEHTRWALAKDTGRIVSAASGWTDFPIGHVFDEHDYSFYPSIASAQDVSGRTIVLGELGGHNLYVPSHTWHENAKPGNNYDFVHEGGRATFKDGAAWQEPYAFYWESIRCLIAGEGLNAAVYTQITDVEHECNGWMTYDRRVSKMDSKKFNDIHQRLYRTPGLKEMWTNTKWKYISVPKVENSGNSPNSDIVESWTRIRFDDSGWQSIQLPITKIEPLSNDPAIMVLRKTFRYDLSCEKPVFRIAAGRTDTGQQPPEKLDGFQRRLSEDFPLQIYLNGKLLRKASFHVLDGHTAVGYLPLRPEEVKRFKKTGNVLAVVIQKTNQIRSFDIRLQGMVEAD